MPPCVQLRLCFSSTCPGAVAAVQSLAAVGGGNSFYRARLRHVIGTPEWYQSEMFHSIQGFGPSADNFVAKAQICAKQLVDKANYYVEGRKYM